MKRVAVLMIGVLLAGQTGCCMFAKATQSLVVASHPEAEIFVDGQRIGTGTATATVRRDQGHIVMAKLDDQTAMISIGTKLSGMAILDIVGGFIFLLPLLGLLTPGASSIDQEAVTLPIERRVTVSK